MRRRSAVLLPVPTAKLSCLVPSRDVLQAALFNAHTVFRRARFWRGPSISLLLAKQAQSLILHIFQEAHA